MPEIFKAYDIRGIYPSELNEETAYKIGRAFVSFLKCRTVAVGRDMRESSEPLSVALMKGIMDQGADVINIGLATTPLLYFAITNYGYDSGIMITASHNPGEWNGFKMCREKAIPLSGDTGIKDIQRLVEENEFKDVKKKGMLVGKAVLSDYMRFLTGFTKGISGLKVVADAGNGMASLTVSKIFRYLDCELVPLYFELDGGFPNHEANPLKEETLKDLNKKVVKEGADFGIAFDGDGDRCCFVDEKGEAISNDLITALIAGEFLKHKPGETVLYDLRSSKVVEEVISKKGKPVMCRVGHAFIKQQMRDVNAVFAGELSGHFYFRHQFFTESDCLPMVIIMRMLCEEGRKLSELVNPLKKYSASGEINSKVKDKDAKLAELEERYKDGKVVKLDGLSVYYGDWWFNARPSNTEPLLRLNIEADTERLMEQKKEELLSIIRG